MIPALVLLAAASAGGCASDPAAHQAAMAFPGDPVAQAITPTADVEDDGLEAQTPPPRRTTPQPDDPAEPFSPNYGAGAQNRAPSPATGQPPAPPRDPPKPARRQLAEVMAR